MTKRKGKFIVIDGADGSGKKTQTNLLADKLKTKGYKIKIADFPQYGKKSAGLVEEYLNGKYGTSQEVTPKQASIFYAIDRFDASFKIKEWLAGGNIVISNRYVSSNMAHQGGKIKDQKERKKFLNWLYELEYDIFNIPKPDLCLILHVSADTAQGLIEEKKNHQRDRSYIKNGQTKDIHEADLDHLLNAEKIYLQIAKSFFGFKLIECMEKGTILSRPKIHNLIWQKVRTII